MTQTPLGFDLEQRDRHLSEARRNLPGPLYYIVLSWIHEIVKPATYLEIGTQYGDSLIAARPETRCIAIDPQPAVNKRLSANTYIYTMTSDEFFERHNPVDALCSDHWSLAFIDGLHLFEQALLDFIHLERFATSDSIAILHDCLPLDRITSARTRTTGFYSGDVWKLTLCLKELRPDLRMAIIPTAPTGLCVVSGLDRHSTILQRGYDACLARYADMDFDDYQMRVLQMPARIPNQKDAVSAYLTDVLAQLRGAPLPT